MTRRLPIPISPARHELLDSYLARLANLHGLDPAVLRAEVGARTPQVEVLSALTGRPSAHLAAALPEVRPGGPDPAIFRHEPQAGCPRCDARHRGGTVLHLLPHHRYLCTRHGYWIGPPDIAWPPTLPAAELGLLRAQRRHATLVRRHGAAATYDGMLTAFLICGHLWVRTPAEPKVVARLQHIWARRTAWLVAGRAEFSASRIFAAVYPEAVALAALLADPRWRRHAYGDPGEQERFLAGIGHQLGGTYVPDETSDAIVHWMTWDAPRPPITARATDPGAVVRARAFATGKANRDRHNRSGLWFDHRPGSGHVILHHRHIRPALVRPWSRAMETTEGAIWASASLMATAARDLVECDK